MNENKLQKEKVTTKKNDTASNLVIILLLATIIVSAVVGLYAWAKYRSAIDGGAEADIAKWHFELKEGTTDSEKTLLAFTRTDENTTVVERKVAPGTYGELPIIIDTTKTEVSLAYDLEVKITNFPKNMKLENSEGQVIPVVSGDGTDDSPRVATIAVSKYVPYNTEESNRLHDETIMWNWEYETGTGDDIVENDKIDTQDAGKEISVSISVTGTQVLEEPLKFQIGKSVNLSTTLNGVELNDWKVFYKEGDYTYLILADYLPNSAVSDTVKTTYNLLGTEGGFNVYSNNRNNLLNAMTNQTNWNSLLTGTINGNSYDYTNTGNENIYANGSPTLELYVKSWNEKYPSNKLYIDTNSNGYYVGTSTKPSSYLVNMSSTQGYLDTLYYPYKKTINKCNGYWLASPSAFNTNNVMNVGCGGHVNYLNYYYTNLAFRPIICLPSNILE